MVQTYYPMMYGFVLVRFRFSYVYIYTILNHVIIMYSLIYILSYPIITPKIHSAFGYSSPLKAYLTQAQIAQFITGLGLSIPLHFVGCLNPASQLALGVLQVYTVVLMGLFLQFYAQSYSRKKQ